MCPSPPLPSTDEISTYWTEEELFMFLDKIKHGSRLPGNVVPDVNPYDYNPSNLPPEVWYFLSSEEKRESETGFWKAKGEGCRIFTNSVINGWRTTFEFYEGQAPNGRKTDWVIQEYRITKGMDENNRRKDYGSLCRVFHSRLPSPDSKMHQNPTSKHVAARDTISEFLSEMLTVENNSMGEGVTSRPQVISRDDETSAVPVIEGLLNLPAEENLPEIDGDYLELLDLVNPVSSSSSSENSSCLSLTSDECFDSLALLRDLESEDKMDQQRKNADCKFSVSAHVKPDEVVMHLSRAESLSLRSGTQSWSPAAALKTDCIPSSSATEHKPRRKWLYVIRSKFCIFPF